MGKHGDLVHLGCGDFWLSSSCSTAEHACYVPRSHQSALWEVVGNSQGRRRERMLGHGSRRSTAGGVLLVLLPAVSEYRLDGTKQRARENSRSRRVNSRHSTVVAGTAPSSSTRQIPAATHNEKEGSFYFCVNILSPSEPRPGQRGLPGQGGRQALSPSAAVTIP